MASLKKAFVVLLIAVLALPAFAAEPAKIPFQTPDTIVVLRTKNLQNNVTQLGNVINSFQPGAGMAVTMSFQQFLQNEGASVNPAAPAALVLLDPEKYPRGKAVVVIFTLKDANFQTQTGFFRIAGTIVAVGESEEAVTQVADAMKAGGIKDVPVADFDDMVVADIPVSAVVNKFRPKLKEGLDEFRKELQAKAAIEPPDVANTLKIGLKLADQVEVLANEIEKQAGPARIGISFDVAAVKLNLKANFVPNSTVAKFMRDQSKPIDPSIAAMLPEKSVMTSIMRHDIPSMERFAAGMTDIWATVFEIPALDRDKTKDAFIAFVKTLSGPQGQAVVQSAEGLAKINVVSVKDAAASRAALKNFFDQFNAGAFGKKFSSFGFTLTPTQGHRDSNGVKIDKVNVAIDPQKLVNMLPMSPMEREDAIKAFNNFLQMQNGKNNVDIEFAYVGNTMIIVNGKDVEKLMDNQIALVKTGAQSIANRAEFKESMAKIQQPGFAVTHIFLYDYLGAIVEVLAAAGPGGGQGIEGVKQFLPTREQLPQKDSPVTVIARTDPAGALTIALDLPLQPIRDIATIVQQNIMRKMQEMMQQQQNGGQPPMPPQQRPMPPRRVQPQPRPQPERVPAQPEPKKPNPQDEEFWE